MYGFNVNKALRGGRLLGSVARSPVPSDVGSAVSFNPLRGEASLTHEFPAVASIVRPRPDERNVSASGLRVTWAAVKGVETIVVLIEDEKTGRDVRATLPGNATSFAVPNGFLTGSTTYKLAIGSVGKGGNRSVTETSFTTGEK